MSLEILFYGVILGISMAFIIRFFQHKPSQNLKINSHIKENLFILDGVNYDIVQIQNRHKHLIIYKKDIFTDVIAETLINFDYKESFVTFIKFKKRGNSKYSEIILTPLNTFDFSNHLAEIIEKI